MNVTPPFISVMALKVSIGFSSVNTANKVGQWCLATHNDAIMADLEQTHVWNVPIHVTIHVTY